MSNGNPPVPTDGLGEVLQSVLIKGDLSKLTAQERVNYLTTVCKALGLNPLTQPFEFIWLSGKLVLYAKKDCTDQLRKLHDVSITKGESKLQDNVLSIWAHGKLPDGREDTDVGSVFFPESVKGELKANLVMKCWTKAKRRTTLSICGLGFLDETEVETIPDARVEPTPIPPQPQPSKPNAGSDDFPGDRPIGKDRK